MFLSCYNPDPSTLMGLNTPRDEELIYLRKIVAIHHGNKSAVKKKNLK